MSDEVTATFIFTDLVDSTALASRVGPDGAETIREAHFGALRDAIGSSCGTEVKNLGDGLMVMFTSARRAVSCAVAMQQAIEVHNRRADEKLSIRVGVAVGEAVVEDGDYFGTPVVEAARLCATCDDDQILVTATVLALAGSAIAHDTRPLGGLELKGLPEPVETVAILWEPEAVPAGGADLPGRVSAVLTGTELGFFGRHDELTLIADVAKTARTEQRPQLVAIAGEPGMGKTTLAARAAHGLVVDDDAIVTFGGCIEGLTAPFEPWIEAVRTLVDTWDPATVEAHLAAHGHTLGAWVRALAVPDADPSAPGVAPSDQLGLFAAAVDVLTRSAGDRPLVVILDDLQWSDSASLQLLRYVLTHESAETTLLLATYRDSDLTAHDPLTALLADLRREPNVTRVDLAGLSDTEMIEFLESAAGHDLSGAGVELAHALRTETKGNPFFTSAMVRHLVDTGAIGQGPSDTVDVHQSVADLGLPNSVREVVAHRVGRLGDNTSTVLNVAAVIGLHFDFDLLVSLVPFDDDEVLDLLEEAMAAALVTEDHARPGQFGFVHGLVREALYQDLGMTRRTRLHQQIAQSLEPLVVEGSVTPAAIATHLIAATRPNDVTKAVRYSMDAGDVAMAALAPVDAADWYRQALELHVVGRDPDPVVRCDLQTRLGRALRQLGDPSHNELLLDTAALAETLGDDARYVEVAIALAFDGSVFTPTEDPARIDVLERALTRVPDDAPAKRVVLLTILANETSASDTARRQDYARRALTLARECGDERARIAAIALTPSALGGPADHELLLAESAWAVAAAERLGDRSLRVRTLHMRANVLATAGRTAESRAAVAQAWKILAGSDILSLQGGLVHLGITYALYDGETAEAERMADERFAVASDEGTPTALLYYGVQLFIIRQFQGRLDELVDLFVGVAHGESGVASANAAAAYMLCSLGRADEAPDVIPFTTASLDAIPVDNAWSTAMRCLAYASAVRGETALASDIYDRLLPHRHLFSNTGISTTGSLEQPLGEVAFALDDHDLAIDHFRAAIAANRSAGARYWVAECQIELAEVLGARGAPGDVAEATGLLVEATDIARTYGFAGLTRRIAAR